MAHALKTFYCRRALGIRVNLDTIGFVWTGELDLNTIRLDEEIFESGKKKLRIQKYPDTHRRGLSVFTWIYMPAHGLLSKATVEPLYNAQEQGEVAVTRK